MKGRLTAKLRSQNGASLSVALLLFLVCAAISAVIIAAATATSGQFAERGKADQRYYAATSAVDLFTESLNGSAPEGADPGDQGTITFQLVQTKNMTQTMSSDGTVTTDPSATTATVEFKKPAATAGFDFLPAATLYAFTGDDSNSTSGLAVKLKTLDADKWIKPFDNGDWTDSLNASKPKEFDYTVTPAFSGEKLPSNAILTANVNGELQSDWTFDLYFSNGDANRTYNVYVALAADVRTDAPVSTVTSATSGSGSSQVITQNVTETQTTTITWRVERVAPGWGGASA